MKVSKQTAMNPVARAMAHNRLEKALRDQRTGIWGYEAGVGVKKEILAMENTMAMTMAAIEFDKKAEDPEFTLAVTVILEALQVCFYAAPEFKWNPEWVVPLDDALDAISLVIPKLTPHAINHGVKQSKAPI